MTITGVEKMRRDIGLLMASLAVAFSGLTGCSTVASIADTSIGGVPGSPSHRMIPGRISRGYETPIPHSGPRLEAASRVDTRGYEKLTSVVGTIFEVGAAFTPPGARPRTSSSLEAARWVCGHGLTLESGKNWWEKVSLQAGGLAAAISQERCFEKYRRVR
jgi:hypothetical protein